MKIQIVTHDVFDLRGAFGAVKECSVNRFDDVDTFDSYGINVIDLTSETIWKNRGSLPNSSNEADNLISIRKMIESSKKTRFVFVLPYNIVFEYSKPYSEYGKKIKLRDNISGIKTILSAVIDVDYSIEYMPNKTPIGGYTALSDFYFTNIPNESVKTMKSLDSEKIVAFEKTNNIYTTLNVLTPELLLPFVDLYSKEQKADFPSWFDQITFNNDGTIKKLIQTKESEIEEAQQIIKKQYAQLDKNNYYKSILFESGDNLVEIVFDILKQLIGKDLSTFVDIKKEDFNYLLDGVYYVGEIKGVSENVKRKHLSELEDNKQDFIDRNSLPFAKGLLIINHQRNKAPADREEVYPDQIAYAKKDELLIIESTTLLEIYECFLKKKLDIDKFKNALRDTTGILKDEWK